MHQELLDLAMKVGNAEQQIKKSSETAAAAGKMSDRINGRVDRLVGQITRVGEMASDSSAQLMATKAMAEEALGSAAKREEEIRNHSGRIATLESRVEELGESARTMRDQIGEVERLGDEREGDRRELVQRMERNVHEVERKTERRVNQLAEDNAARIKELRRELDEKTRIMESRYGGKSQNATCDGPCACTRPGAHAGKCVDSGAREQIKRESERVSQSLNQLQRKLESLGGIHDTSAGSDRDTVKREIEKIQGKIRSMASIFDQQHQKDVDSVGRFREAIRVINVKVDKLLANSGKEISDIKRSIDQRREEIVSLGERLDKESMGHQTFYGMKREEAAEGERRPSARRSGSIDVSQRGVEEGGIERKLGQIQGELRAAKEYMKDEEGKRKSELETMKRDSAKIEEEVRSLGTRVAETEKIVKEMREVAFRKIEGLKKSRDHALERERVAERDARDAVRRLDMLESELENREKKVERLMDEVREKMKNAASSERADSVYAKVLELEEKMMSTIGENAAPAGHTIGEPR